MRPGTVPTDDRNTAGSPGQCFEGDTFEKRVRVFFFFLLKIIDNTSIVSVFIAIVFSAVATH